MAQTIKITEDISLVIEDRLLEKLIIVPKKTGKRSKLRRLSVMRNNLIKDAQALQREAKRHKPFVKISYSSVKTEMS